MSSLKETGNLDGGTATIIGATDWDTLVSYFKNKLNAFVATINSPTTFRWGKFLLRNNSDSASQTLNAGNVTGPFTMTLPSYDANDELVSCNAPGQRLKGKIFDFSENTVIGAGTGGTMGEGKWGLIQAPRNANDGTVSQGTLSGHINMGTASIAVDPPPAGTHWQYDTGSSSSNVNAGVRWNDAWLRRDFNPKLRVKYRIPVGPTGAQFLCGFSSDTDISGTQSPIESTQSGVLVGYQTDHANYVVIRNDGTNSSSSSPTVDDTALTATVAKSTSLYRIVEVAFQNQGTECKITISKFDTTPPYGLTQEFQKIYTTKLPAITNPGTGGSIYMRPVFQITNKEPSNHQIELFKMELNSDF